MKNPNVGQIFAIPSDKTLPQVFTITPRQRNYSFHFSLGRKLYLSIYSCLEIAALKFQL